MATAGGKRKRTRLGPPTPETWAHAAEKQRDIERALRIATGGAAPLGIPTLALAIETYLASMRDHAHSTRVTRRQQLPKFLPRLGDRRIDRVSPDDVLSWWAEFVVEGGRGYRTGMGHLEALSQVFEHAADLEGVQVVNPVPTARRKLRRRAARTKAMRGLDEKNRRPLTQEELRAFVPALLRAKPEAVLLGLLLLDAGLRFGEAQGLRWCDVRDGHLDIRQSIDMAGGASSPKSGLGRTVPLSRRLRALLGRLRAERPHDPPQARVLRMTRRETYRGHLAAASRAAGLKRVVRPKDLRDTFASQLLTAGVTLAWISKRLGHQTVVVTAKHYATWAEADYRAPLVLAEGEVPPDLLARIDGTANATGT